MPIAVPLGLVAVLAAVLAVLVVVHRRQAAAALDAEVRRDALAARADAARATLDGLVALSEGALFEGALFEGALSEGAPRNADGLPDRSRHDDARRPDARRRPHASRPPRPVSDPLPPARP